MIVCTGESLIDFVPLDTSAEGLPAYQPVPGGSPLNCAIAAARLGAAVAFLGAVSTDFFGEQIVASLHENNVDISLVRRVNHPTTLAFVKKKPSGAAQYAFFTNSAADRAFTVAHLPAQLPPRAILQLGSISIIPDPEGSTIISLAEREHGSRVIAFDPNIRESLVQDAEDYRHRVSRILQVATILKTSDEDLSWIFPNVPIDEAVQKVLRAGTALVVLTRGADGSVAYTNSTTVAVAAEPVAVSDTIGAGDSFLAALLVWLDEHDQTNPAEIATLDGNALQDALRFAGRVAAITCTRAGARPPFRSEVDS